MVLPEHESQMTRLLIQAFTEEGLLYPVIAFEHGYHGRTYRAMVITAKSHR